MFAGSIVALVTPFENDRIDEGALKKMIDWHVDQGTNAIVPCGTTGESATFTHEEQFEMIKLTVDLVAGRVPVIAGAGSNSTKEAVSLAEAATQAGANGILSVTPYYNKPSPDGLIAHYQAIGGATDLPIVLYNVPSRTGTNMLPETCAAIAETVNVDSVKEASGNISQTQDLLDLGLRVLSGEDGLTFPMMCVGASGTISVVANFAPKLVSDMCAAAAAGDLENGRRLQKDVHALTKLAFCETNPLPAKTAVSALGFCKPDFRLPLTHMSEAGKERILAAIKEYNLQAAVTL